MCCGLLPSHATHRARQSTWQDSETRAFLLPSDCSAFCRARNPAGCVCVSQDVVRVLDGDWARWKEAACTSGRCLPRSLCVLCPHARAHIARRRDSFTLHSINVYSAPLLWGHREEQIITFILRQLAVWWVDGESTSVRARTWSPKSEDGHLTACVARVRLTASSNVCV